MAPLELHIIPESLLVSVRGCLQFQELLSLPCEGAYSTSSHVRNVNIRKGKSLGRPPEIVVDWTEVPDSLKVGLVAFIGCNAHDLTSVSFMIFQRGEGIDSHCDEKWVGDSFWGFSIILKSEPSSAEPYTLVFTSKKNDTVVGELVVLGNTAYHCSGNNRHKLKHSVAPSKCVGRRFFLRAGHN